MTVPEASVADDQDLDPFDDAGACRGGGRTHPRPPQSCSRNWRDPRNCVPAIWPASMPKWQPVALLQGTIITLVRQDGTRALFSELPPAQRYRDGPTPIWCNACSRPARRRCRMCSRARSSRVPLAVIAVPIKSGNAVIYSLHLTLRVGDFSQLLSAHHCPSTWLSGIVDRHGRFLARVPDNEKRAGQLASQGGAPRSACAGGDVVPVRRAGRPGRSTTDTRRRANPASSSGSACRHAMIEAPAAPIAVATADRWTAWWWRLAPRSPHWSRAA